MQAKAISLTTGMSREDWLAVRRRGIGGSDAAAIVGMSRYASPYSVWADKTGRLPERETDERMRIGIYLEPYVADRFAKITGKRVRRRNAVLSHPHHPFMLANIDREVVGERAGLECKTTSALNLKAFRDGNYPEEYYVQCVHYLAVTGYERWYLCVTVLGSPDEPKIYTIERDEAEINALIKAESEFWFNHVVPDAPPAVDGTDSTSGALSVVYPGGDVESITINQPDAIANYLALGSQIKVLTEHRERAAQTIKAAVGDCERAVCGPYRVSWATQTRNDFDHKSFIRDHPNLDMSRYFKTSTSRRFTVKEDQ